MRTFWAITCSTVLGVAWPAYGHHSDAGYDHESVVAFEGVVSRYVFRNPHVTIFVEAEDERGERIEWELETGSTPIMSRSGWSRELLSPGDTVTIRAHPERTGRPRAMLSTLETTDGRLWSQVEADPEATPRATSLDGVWKALVDSVGFRQQLSHSPLTEAGRAAEARFDYFRDSPVAECIAGPPPDHIASATYLTEIQILEDRAILRNEYFDVTRTVYMDGRGHPEDGERTNEGHSIGWWEDDVLVVDTTLFADHVSGNGRGVPSGAQKHLVERYSLNEDGSRAIIEVFLEDPEFLAEPFSGRMEMVYTPNLELFSYGCVPELSRQSGFE